MKEKRLLNLVLILLLSVLHATAQARLGCDFSGDGVVNFQDFTELSETWDACLPWGPDGLPNQLIAHWRLDGDVRDSQSVFHGQIYGDPVWLKGIIAAVGSGAIGMDGEDYIQIDCNDFPNLDQSFAIDAWIQTSGSGQDQIVISKGNSSWQLGIDGLTGCVVFSCPGVSGDNYLTGQTTITNNQWHHVAGVYDQDQQKMIIYLDNAIDAENTASGFVNSREGDIWIGGDPETAGLRKWWHGNLDNVRIFNYAPTKYELFQRKTYHVDQSQGSNGNSGQGRLNAFKTIQKAVDTAADGDQILVWPGIYEEAVLFWEFKSLTVRSASDAAVIKAPADYAVSFYSGATGTVLENFVICDSEIGIFVEGSRPALNFLTIVNNDSGIEGYGGSDPIINHCIIWDNLQSDVYNQSYSADITFSCIERFVSGEGNFSMDPLFADPNNPDPNKRDYHLKSETGRCLSQDPNNPGSENWISDTQTSPCVDAGNEFINPMRELMPNGGRLNIGAYANTKYASKSPWPYPADLNHNGHVGWEDLHAFIENWLHCEPG